MDSKQTAGSRSPNPQEFGLVSDMLQISQNLLHFQELNISISY